MSKSDILNFSTLSAQEKKQMLKDDQANTDSFGNTHYSSHWHHVYRKLKISHRFRASLFIIIFLLLFALLGPIFWAVDPTTQDLYQISSPPSLPQKVYILEHATQNNTTPASSIQQNAPSMNITLHKTNPLSFHIKSSNTYSVEVAWQSQNSYQKYQLYRNHYHPQSTGSFGIMLAETDESHYIDKLALENRQYYYSLVPLDVDNQPIANESISISTTPTPVIPLTQLQKLYPNITIEPNQPMIDLPWHPLGTDYLGRDMLARLIHGSHVSLFIGIFTPCVFLLIGSLYGAIAGLCGGYIDQIMMRFADLVIALPFLLFMILIRVAFGIQPGDSGLFPMILAMILLSWPGMALLIRGQILQLREEGYIHAAKMMGATHWYIVYKHMLPNTLNLIIVTLTFAIPSAIFTEAFLSFISMGVAPPTPSWGSMANEGLNTMLITPHELLLPSFFISITVLAFNLLGDGLRDALDVRSKVKPLT